jgi:hypothetical protein
MNFEATHKGSTQGGRPTEVSLVQGDKTGRKGREGETRPSAKQSEGGNEGSKDGLLPRGIYVL